MMSEQAFDNPPAFPGVAHFTGSTHGEGMSLRDWFAGQALTGGMAAADDHNFSTPEKCALQAYQIADAMLAARAEQVS